jgi:glycosyltransferase involved in cell wall biosynthesis
MKVLVLVVAYNAERTIQQVLKRIPAQLREHYETDVLIIDDSSQDETFQAGVAHVRAAGADGRLTILRNPVNHGYGGNQKLGYRYAITRGYDVVALLHGDGQYPPEELLNLIAPIIEGKADAVFGSRMMGRGGALKGGMPLYKYVGNRILTWYENWLLKASLTEYHSGYRAYSVKALRQIPFEYNTNDFHFDTEIIVQFMNAGYRICEIPIPTYYGDEICHVNGLKYAWNVVKTVAMSRAQNWGVLYDRKYDCRQGSLDNRQYYFKDSYRSSHSISISLVRPQSAVLDLGCGAGHIGRYLRERKGCHVVGIDRIDVAPDAGLDRSIVHDLNDADLPVKASEYDYVLLLDIIEHLHSPESFMEHLREAACGDRGTLVLVSVPNIAFLPLRLMLLLGQFNYGKRGILDLTHTRLFTFKSLRHLFDQTGWQVLRLHGVPAPWPLIWGRGAVGRFFVWINAMAICLWKRMFSYQIFALVKPLPTVDSLLQDTMQHTQECLRNTAACYCHEDRKMQKSQTHPLERRGMPR